MKIVVAFLSVGLALVVVAGATSLLADAATRSVEVRDDTYVDGVSGSNTSTIVVGDTVQWNWTGSNQHTVDNNGGSESFSSGAPQTAGSFSHIFNAAGTYNYICGVHGTAMQGTIIVQAAQAPTNTPAPQATNTAVPQSSSTPTGAGSGTNTPAVGTTTTPGTPTSEAGASSSATPSAPQAAPTGGALPSAGHGGLEDGRNDALVFGSVAAALVGTLLLGSLVFRRRRES